MAEWVMSTPEPADALDDAVDHMTRWYLDRVIDSFARDFPKLGEDGPGRRWFSDHRARPSHAVLLLVGR